MARQAVSKKPDNSSLRELEAELKAMGVVGEEAEALLNQAQGGKIPTSLKPRPSDPAREKDAAFITSVVKRMEKQFGEGAALTPTSETVLCKVEHWVSTRNFLIDSAIAGGLPMPRPLVPFGRMTEISGLNTTGKTTLMGMIIAETQATGGIAAVSDTEEALDLAYWEQIGVDLSRLIIIPALTIEEVFTKVESMVDVIREMGDERLICIGWDSLGGTPTKEQEAAAADDKFYASAAKVVGQNLQRIIGKISKKRIALVINNHLYRKMDVKYGDPWETYGGEKMKFFATLRIRLQQIGQINEGSDEEKQTIGHLVKVKIIKNKMAPILRSVEVPCIGGYGFSLDYSVYEHAQKQGLITGKQWKEWNGTKFQGWRGFRDKIMTLSDYPELVQKVINNYHTKMTVK
jgi:recombination protein RecA